MIVDMSHNEALGDEPRSYPRIWQHTLLVSQHARLMSGSRRHCYNPKVWIDLQEMADFMRYLDTTAGDADQFFAELGLA